jgi:F0F1-type ATP synthase membrane subunit b/b'
MKFVKEILYFISSSFFSRLVVLQSIRSEYEHILKLKTDLERQLEEYTNELLTTKTMASSITNQLKEKLEQISAEKVIRLFNRLIIRLFSRKNLMKITLDYVFNYIN